MPEIAPGHTPNSLRALANHAGFSTKDALGNLPDTASPGAGQSAVVIDRTAVVDDSDLGKSRRKVESIQQYQSILTI